MDIYNSYMKSCISIQILKFPAVRVMRSAPFRKLVLFTFSDANGDSRNREAKFGITELGEYARFYRREQQSKDKIAYCIIF